MPNFKKIIATSCLTLTLGGFITPVLTNTTTYAQSTSIEKTPKNKFSKYIDDYNYIYISKLNKEKAETYKTALKISISNRSLSKESINNVINKIDKLAAKENGIPIIETRGNFWDGQGITTDELGATIDAAIVILSGGGAAGIKEAAKALINKVGQKQAINMIINKLKELGLKQFANKVKKILPWAIFLTSPGRAIAEYIDSFDFYPNNGRINAWK